MESYRIVGSFNAQTIKTADGKEKLKLVSAKSRTAQKLSYQARDITTSYATYQPVNLYSTHSEYRGLIWGHIKLASGDIWPDWEGQRIIVEASSRRVIYMKNSTDGSRKIYIQSPRDFITNVTTDTFNRKSAEKTKAVKRLAEWEVHFLTGFLGAAHWVGLVAVLSGDVLQQIFAERKRNTEYREASKDIIDVDKDLKKIAPVYRGKLLEVLIAGVKTKPGEKVTTFMQALPDIIVKDDKTTGRIAGAIAAKFIINPKNNKLVWFFIFQTVAIQVATKSASKVPPALGKTMKSTFDRLMPDLDNLDPNSPDDQKVLLEHMMNAMNELGVSVSLNEARQMMEEMQRSPKKITADMQKLGKAFEKLSKAGSSE